MFVLVVILEYRYSTANNSNFTDWSPLAGDGGPPYETDRHRDCAVGGQHVGHGHVRSRHHAGLPAKRHRHCRCHE